MKRQCGKKCHKNISSSDAPKFNSPTNMDEGIQNQQIGISRSITEQRLNEMRYSLCIIINALFNHLCDNLDLKFTCVLV